MLDISSEVDSSKVWSSENTLALINVVAEHYQEFSVTLKKTVWDKVAKKLSKTIKKPITATMCETKWKTLKRTYKSIVIANQTSGQKRRYWEFFNVMNDLLFDKPEINPVATCSSLTGFQRTSGNEPSNEPNKKNESKTSRQEPGTLVSSEVESAFVRKRKQRESESERRHREKMSRLDRFNDIFERMVEKLPSNNNEHIDAQK